MQERYIHPDFVLGPEEALYRAGEEVWIEAILEQKNKGNHELAEQILNQQFRRDEDGNIFVEIGNERLLLGHVSLGFEILHKIINRQLNGLT